MRKIPFAAVTLALAAMAVVALLPTFAYAQGIGTYTEDNGAVRNNIGIGGGLAVSAPATGNPIRVGGVYNPSPTAVQSGDIADIWLNPQGALMVGGQNQGAGADASASVGGFSINDSAGGVPLMVAPSAYNGATWDRIRGNVNGIVTQPALSTTFWNYAPPVGGINNSTTAVTVRAAAGAGVRNYIKSLQLTADTLGAATEFAIRDGAAGTVLARIKVNTAGLTASGTTIFDPPLRGTANTLVEIVTLTASVTGGVFANLQGYTGN